MRAPIQRFGYTIPQTTFLFATTFFSLLFGGSIAHGILRPDLTLPLPKRDGPT
jgi:hypothetical protein